MTSVDQPALEDAVTARLFELSAQRVVGTTAWQLMTPGLIVLVVWMWTITPVFAVGCLAAGLIATWQYFAQHLPGSLGWSRSAGRLLAAQRWRELPATVLDRRGTVVALPDGSQLRIHGLSRPAREVAVRAGRIWVVGPDCGGWYAARVDGGHMPLPARHVSARPAEPASPAGEPVVAPVDPSPGQAEPG